MTRPEGRLAQRLRLILLVILYLCAHVALYWVSEKTQRGSFSLWYPPSGLILAVVMRMNIFGAVLAIGGAFLGEMIVPDEGIAPFPALALSFIPALAALWTRQLMIAAGFANPRMVSRVRLAIASILACGFFALVTTLCTLLLSKIIDFGIGFTPLVFLNWMLGDFLGSLTVFFLSMQLIFPLLVGEQRLDGPFVRRYLPVLLGYALLALAPQILLERGAATSPASLALFTMLPIFHATLRRGAGETALAIFLVNMALLVSSPQIDRFSAFELQAYALIVSLCGVIGSALVTHQRAMTGTLTQALMDRDRLNRERSQLERQLATVQRLDALGQMAGGLAHEINNLLHPILSFARAAGDASDAQRAHYLQRIRECAQGARMIVADVLAFARNTANSDEQPPSEVNAADCIRDCFAIATDGIDDRVAVFAQIDLAEQRLRISPPRLTQIFINLVRNACDAMPEGGDLRLHAEAITLDSDAAAAFAIAPGDFVRIAVADTGVGMDHATLQRALEPFFTTKAIGRGTGLGLSVAFGLIRQWHGQLQLESEPGQGCRAVVLLPVARA